MLLSVYTDAIKSGYYKNMRTLKNDIEDALNVEVLKARGFFHRKRIRHRYSDNQIICVVLFLIIDQFIK